MAQDKVIKYLMKSKTPKNAKRIAKAIKIGYGSTSKALSKLKERGEIEAVWKKVDYHCSNY